jgi:hypothetical protein
MYLRSRKTLVATAQLVSRVCFLVSELRLSDRKSLGVITGVGLLAIRGGPRAKETYDSLEVSIGHGVEAWGCSMNSQPRYNLLRGKAVKSGMVMPKWDDGERLHALSKMRGRKS